MTNRLKSLSAALIAVTAFAVVGAAPSFALTAQECSAKYNAAKAGGTLNGLKWNDFRKAQCGDDAAAAPAKAAEPAKPTAEAAKPAAKPAAAAVAGGAVFPKAVDALYSKESAGKARMHTCRDQYKANKASNGNGGLKWIMKGGGYYSQCNKALKS
jgi:hypothetical protein